MLGLARKSRRMIYEIGKIFIKIPDSLSIKTISSDIQSYNKIR